MEVSDLANIKSAKKRILVIETKTLRNKMIKSKVKTMIKNVEAAIESGNKAEAEAKLKVAISEISKAASKGIYHKNNASRKISHLTLAVNRMA
ncbi:MAG: 30S ribosomal protein S20 [Clostridium sp.]|nr:30S ribosomal protein S20 [Clostridium sp.]MCM1399747.1 30S ribosomal protein S20 [Clostridium sp.]